MQFRFIWSNLLNISIIIHVLYIIGCHGYLLDSDDGISDIPDLAEPPLNIASFNIQVFGQTKFGHQEIMAIIVKILTRYDIIQVLEIRDSKNTVFEGLQVALNDYVTKQNHPEHVYDKIVSERLGRTNSKEQYGFLFRPSVVQLTAFHQFNDTNDVFEREPFGVRFSCGTTVVEDFGIIAIHTKPAMVAEEVGNLTRVYQDFADLWNLKDLIIAGDFNADCNYLRLSEWNNITLRTDTRFSWLISDSEDTTIADSTCSYDRFVVAGNHFPDAVVTGSVKAYRFDEQMNIGKQTALRVSDHYPIEMQIKGKPHLATQQNIQTSINFNVKDTESVSNVNAIRGIYHNPSCAGPSYDIQVLKQDSHMHSVVAHAAMTDASHVMTDLAAFRKACPGTLSGQLLSTVFGYLKSEFLTDTQPNVYGLAYHLQKRVFDTYITCSLQSPYCCEVTVTKQISGNRTT